MKLKPLFIAALFLASFTAGHAQPLDKAKLDRFFDRLAEKNQAMGSLVIVKDGQTVYDRAIGYSQVNATEKKPLTSANRFRIGSITKMFTTVMIYQLIEEGKLKPTDTLDRFIPQIPNAAKITIAHILGHRSGIPNVRREQNAEGNVSTLPMTKEEHLALIVKTAPDFEPDARHLYSNSGYFVLGLIIEKLTGKSYADVLRDKITSRIGLNDTYVATGNIDVGKNEALTYSYVGGWKPHAETHPSIFFGAGQIISTTPDLAKFIAALFDLKLVSAENLAAMKTMREGEGKGMEPFQFAGKTFFGHTGGGDNYGSWLAYLPEEKLAFSYMTNAKVWPVGNIMNGIAEIYYGRPFEIPAFAALEVSPELLDRYVGVYAAADAPVKFTITREGATLFAQPPGQSKSAPLEATAQDKFQISSAGPFFEFDAAKNQMTIKRRGAERVFTKEP